MLFPLQFNHTRYPCLMRAIVRIGFLFHRIACMLIPLLDRTGILHHQIVRQCFCIRVLQECFQGLTAAEYGSIEASIHKRIHISPKPGINHLKYTDPLVRRYQSGIKRDQTFGHFPVDREIVVLVEELVSLFFQSLYSLCYLL